MTASKPKRKPTPAERVYRALTRDRQSLYGYPLMTLDKWARRREALAAIKAALEAR